MDEPQPEFDYAGYPTDATLEYIEQFAAPDHFYMLIDFVSSAWYFYGARYNELIEDGAVRRWTFSTCGWSGNESLIYALQRNRLFWAVCWYQSKRGGQHIFDVKVKKTLTD